MYQSRGQLNKKELTELSQAEVVTGKSVDHKSATTAPVKEKKNKKKKKSFTAVVLLIGLFIVVIGIGVGIYSDTLNAGMVGVDELKAATVTLNINSTPISVDTNAETVEELLNEQRIRLDERDYLAAELDAPIYDGMVIWLRLGVDIRINVDGDVLEVVSQPLTVQDALKLAGVTLNELDEVSLPLLQYIYNDTVIDVSRVWQEEVNEDQPIAPETVTQELTYLAPGSTTEINPGRQGILRGTFLVTYRDGEEIAREEIDSFVAQEPVDRVVGVGPSTSTVSSTDALTATTEDGATFYYTDQFIVETTAYTWTGYRTATGTVPKVGTIAVDPSVIPLGTKVYIVGYGFATAEDTGGAVKGNIVDLYMDTEDECIQWGRRDAVIYLLAE